MKDRVEAVVPLLLSDVEPFHPNDPIPTADVDGPFDPFLLERHRPSPPTSTNALVAPSSIHLERPRPLERRRSVPPGMLLPSQRHRSEAGWIGFDRPDPVERRRSGPPGDLRPGQRLSNRSRLDWVFVPELLPTLSNAPGGTHPIERAPSDAPDRRHPFRCPPSGASCLLPRDSVTPPCPISPSLVPPERIHHRFYVTHKRSPSDLMIRPHSSTNGT